MAEKYAGLSLGVDVSQVDKAVKSLNDFAKANDNAADKVGDFINEAEIAKQKAKDHAAALAQTRKEYAGIVAAIDPTVSKMEALRATAGKLDALWQKGVIPDKEFFRLSGVLETQEAALRRNQKALTEEGRAALEASRAKEAAAKAGQAFLNGLQQQADAAGKTATEMLQLKAAQLGVSEQAAPLIAQLTKQGNGLKLAGLSAGQYSQAMKMLPMQITDVVTSLASGMPVWMVAIQQGGQIKDSFGGIGNTFKVLLSYLNPMRVGVGLAAAGFAALSISVYKSRKELEEMKSKIQETSGAGSDYAERLALNIRKISEASQETSEDVLKAFVTTKDGAQDALQKMLDVGIGYDEAKTKVEQYKATGNFTALNADIEKHRLKVLEIKGAWSDSAEEVRNYYTAANEGKQNVALGGAIDPIIKVLERAKALQKGVNQARIDGNKEVAKTAELIKQQYLASNQVAGAEERLKEARKMAQKVSASGNKELIKQSQDLIAQREKELKQAKETEAKRGKAKQPKKEPIVKGATEQLDKELYVLEAQLKTLRQHKNLNDTISAQRKSLWAIEGQIQVLEEAGTKRKLTAQEKELLVSQKKLVAAAQRKADLGDEIVKQERLNALQDKSLKFIIDMNNQTELLNKTKEMGLLAAQREAELAQIRTDWKQAGGKDDDAGLQKMIEKREKFYATEDEKRADWLAGAKSAFETYGEDATNMYDNVGQVATQALDGMANLMTDFLTTGKADFADFAKSIISMIVKMIAQMVIFNAISGAVGGKTWSFAGASAGGGVAAASAIPDVASAIAAPASAANDLGRATRATASGAAAAMAGSSMARMVSGGNSGGGTFVDVSGMKVDVNNGNDPRGMEAGVRMIFNDMMNEACSQGGKVYNYINEKTGG